ncbi:hypothetical protein, partial [Paenibacillus alba]
SECGASAPPCRFCTQLTRLDRKPAKMQAFRSNESKNIKSLRLCRLFELFHPRMEKRPQKDAQSQAFHHFACYQGEKDA